MSVHSVVPINPSMQTTLNAPLNNPANTNHSSMQAESLPCNSTAPHCFNVVKLTAALSQLRPYLPALLSDQQQRESLFTVCGAFERLAAALPAGEEWVPPTDGNKDVVR